jgi:hypothetical protein
LETGRVGLILVDFPFPCLYYGRVLKTSGVRRGTVRSKKKSVKRFMRGHSTFFRGLAIITVVLAPVLVSPYLRAAIIEWIPTPEEIGLWIFSERAVEVVTALGVFAAVTAIVFWLTYLLLWFWCHEGTSLSGWRRWAYIASALALFLISLVSWGWGLVEFGQREPETLSGEEVVLFVIGLPVLGILSLILIRPAIWAVEMLRGKDGWRCMKEVG